MEKAKWEIVRNARFHASSKLGDLNKANQPFKKKSG